MVDSLSSEPKDCPNCGCESVACTCGYTAEIRGLPELVEEEDAHCEHGVHYMVECEKCQEEVDAEQDREERQL